MPGALPLILKAENDEDHQRWTVAFEKCKYEELDDIMLDKYRANLPSKSDVFQDPDYEMPVHVIEQMERMRKVDKCLSLFTNYCFFANCFSFKVSFRSVEPRVDL